MAIGPKKKSPSTNLLGPIPDIGDSSYSSPRTGGSKPSPGGATQPSGSWGGYQSPRIGGQKQMAGAPVSSSQVDPRRYGSWGNVGNVNTPAADPFHGSNNMLMKGYLEKLFEKYGKQLSSPGMGEEFAAGVDLSGPSATMQQHQQMRGNLDPGALQNWWQENAGKFDDPLSMDQALQSFMQAQQGRGPGSNYTEQGLLNLDLEADMNPFYDRAREKTLEQLNRAAAARGRFGSTSALDQITEAMSSLSARQAMDEARYGLDRAAELRGWSTAADELSRAQDALDLRWGLGAGEMAGARDKAVLDRLMGGAETASQVEGMGVDKYLAGIQGASAADLADIDRVRTEGDIKSRGQNQMVDRLTRMFDAGGRADRGRIGRLGFLGDQVTRAFQSIFGPVLGSSEKGLSQDQDLFETMINARMGGTQTGVAAGTRASDDRDQDITNIFSAIDETDKRGGFDKFGQAFGRNDHVEDYYNSDWRNRQYG